VHLDADGHPSFQGFFAEVFVCCHGTFLAQVFPMTLTRLVVCTANDEVLFAGVSERARPTRVAPTKSDVVPVFAGQAGDGTDDEDSVSGVYRVTREGNGLVATRVPAFEYDEDDDTGDYAVPVARCAR
jgi:hypothetical protein